MAQCDEGEYNHIKTGCHGTPFALLVPVFITSLQQLVLTH